VRARACFRPALLSIALLLLTLIPAGAQLPRTPLAQATLDLLADEISGQMAQNIQIKLAGAPWLRDPRGFTDAAKALHDATWCVKSCGIETVRMARHASAHVRLRTRASCG
jgi:hypothetical protein